ncbi:hypothetical protein TNCT_691881 [Trichonephila clavata]|uniref:Uncharacterized protein n=1 Tax=Trichonephila clavata TaxID=2740835 RepID=A0A8X6LQM2_TRICU|nr:hypothetical protein TNCT_691881 [Trichonephila clavata]
MIRNYELQLLDRILIKPWKSEDLLTIPNCPRREDVAKFRLLTDRDCLGEHLHRIGILDQPNCPLVDLAEPLDQASSIVACHCVENP